MDASTAPMAPGSAEAVEGGVDGTNTLGVGVTMRGEQAAGFAVGQRPTVEAEAVGERRVVGRHECPAEDAAIVELELSWLPGVEVVATPATHRLHRRIGARASRWQRRR